MTEALKERIEEIAQMMDWEVNMWTSTLDGTIYIEFETLTPAGQDLIVTVSRPAFNKMYDVSLAIWNYAENFDECTETYIRLDETGYGSDGSHMREVLSDMEKAKDMIYALADEMK